MSEKILTFKEVCNSFKDLVFNLALHYSQNQQDAEEITQDVFVRVYKNLDKFNQQSSLKTWIYRIAVNQSLDFIRSQKRQKMQVVSKGVSIDDPDYIVFLNHFDHPGVQLESKEALAQLFWAINQLPEKQKTALILLKLEQKTQKETAVIMKTTPKAVESLFMRAKTKLSKILEESKEN